MNKGMLICSFSLKKRYGKKEDIVYLNDKYELNNNGVVTSYDDIFSMLIKFCENNENYSDDELLQKMFAIDGKTIEVNEDEISKSMLFEIKSGSYGIESDMTDRNTKKIKYHRSKDEADIKKFLCCIYVLKDVSEYKIKKGVIIFQSIGQYGVKTLTSNYLREFFSDIGITLEIRSVSPKAFFDKIIEEGKIKKLTIIRNSISRNIADNLLISTGKESVSYINPTFQNEGLKKLVEMFNSKSNKEELDLHEILDEETEDIILNFNLNGNSRTIRLTTLDKLSIVEDIPKTIKTKEQVVEYIKKTAESYKEHLICH